MCLVSTSAEGNLISSLCEKITLGAWENARLVRRTRFLFPLLFSAEELRILLICEGGNGKITCQKGEEISIQDANYGRLDRDTCLHRAMSNINCRASNSLQIVQDKCNGKTECQLQAASSEFGGDPCGGTYKYLKVKYRCLELYKI